jgi:hypothetical protein
MMYGAYSVKILSLFTCFLAAYQHMVDKKTGEYGIFKIFWKEDNK